MRDKKGRFVKGHIGYKAMLGKNQTESAKKKMSVAKTGKPLLKLRGKKRPPFSKEWRENMSNGHKGEKAYNWKGNNAGINAIHIWIMKEKGRPEKCELCGASSKGRRFDWANKDHTYKRKLEDYMWVCRSCHRYWDIIHNKYKQK